MNAFAGIPYVFSSSSPLNTVQRTSISQLLRWSYLEMTLLQHVRGWLLQWANLWRHSSIAPVSLDSSQQTHLSSEHKMTWRRKIDGATVIVLNSNITLKMMFQSFIGEKAKLPWSYRTVWIQNSSIKAQASTLHQKVSMELQISSMPYWLTALFFYRQ